ncbi:MAG: chorismate-binding protein [Chromatiales bacterium]|nr:chorismate-binding protein [Chromatiales bacterium]
MMVEFRTGAGIVADSRPEAELAETRAKARGLLRALGSNDMIGRRAGERRRGLGHLGGRPRAAVRRRPVRDDGGDGRPRAALRAPHGASRGGLPPARHADARPSTCIDAECERVAGRPRRGVGEARS